MKDWLTREGCFKWGKHKDEPVEDVAKTDPDYLEYIVYKVEDVSDEDRDIMAQLLARQGR